MRPPAPPPRRGTAGRCDRCRRRRVRRSEGDAAGVAERVEELAQALARGEHHVVGQPGHREHAPRQGDRLDPHRGVLELGLPRVRAERGLGDRVDAGERTAVGVAAADELAAPVHRDRRLRQADRVRRLGGQHEGAAPARDADQLALADAAAGHVGGMQLHRRLGHVREQPPERAGAGHAVPLVA
jgi:hypothetical protein